MQQLALFAEITATKDLPTVALTPELSEALALNVPVAIGVSGGKDSTVAAWATINYLNQIGHTGERILIHSDLGRVEWKDSLPICEKLAMHLNTELVVVRRKSGDMVDRWLQRWNDNVIRYQELSCVKLILPWSTPSMRFCTSEMKTSIIWRYLKKRWPTDTVLSVTGIRRQESTNRAKQPVAKPKLAKKDSDVVWGMDWHSVIDWKVSDVWNCHDLNDLPRHEAYTTYGSSRVSCAFCVLASKPDLWSSSTCADNADLYRELVDLEVQSTFSFQSNQWLADINPKLLSEATLNGLAQAKKAAEVRELAESRIPQHLHFKKGWPECMPTQAEAKLLASVRNTVASATGLTIDCTDADSIRERYADLLTRKGEGHKIDEVNELADTILFQ